MEKRVNLIPMAGAGQRFVDAGYEPPKPLIEVAGKSMILKAAESLPPADQWIFVCQDLHIKESQIDARLSALFENAKVLSVDGLTEGQACTCLLAKDFLDPNSILTIGACDNAMSYDRNRFDEAIEDPEVDALIWTFRNNQSVLQNPNMYGWVEVGDENYVKGVSCKVPISKNPLEDHAIIGSFTFKRAGDFVECAQDLIMQDRRINNEFYVDVVMDVAVQKGLKVMVFEVDQYICWGTPADLEIYEYWRSYFLKEGLI